MAPEQLFIQRAVQWVRARRARSASSCRTASCPTQANDEAIRRWILRNCWVLASVELPVETFIHDAASTS